MNLTFSIEVREMCKIPNCSYLVSLRQERGGGVQEKIFVSKPINLSKCLTLGFLSFNVAFRIVDTFAPFPKFGDIVSQKSCRYAVCVFVLFFGNVGSGLEEWRELGSPW